MGLRRAEGIQVSRPRGFGKPQFLSARSAKMPKLIEGSKRKPCSKCGAKVWTTPGMLKLGTKLLCPKCAPKPRAVG